MAMYRPVLRRCGTAGRAVDRCLHADRLRCSRFSFVFNWIIDAVVGQRVSAKAELEGLDLPEMGALCYPEFEIKATSVGAMGAA